MIDNTKNIISFTKDGKTREIMGQLNQLAIVLKRMKGDISTEEI